MTTSRSYSPTAALLLEQILSRVHTRASVFYAPQTPFLTNFPNKLHMSKISTRTSIVICLCVLCKRSVNSCKLFWNLIKNTIDYVKYWWHTKKALLWRWIKMPCIDYEKPISHAPWSLFATWGGLTGKKEHIRQRKSQWVMRGRAWPISMWHAKSSKSH